MEYLFENLMEDRAKWVAKTYEENDKSHINMSNFKRHNMSNGGHWKWRKQAYFYENNHLLYFFNIILTNINVIEQFFIQKFDLYS